MDDGTVKSRKELDPTVDFIAGTVAGVYFSALNFGKFGANGKLWYPGVAGLTIAYPFDTVKVRFQSPGISSKYRSTFHAFSTIVREEHFKGLYKGIASPMISCAPLNGLVFASYRFFMRLQLDHADDVPTITQIGFAGIGSGITASLITCPIELIKIRQQSIVDRQPSTRLVAADLFRRTGVRGLYRGLVPTALRDVGYGAYFATYEATCRYFSSRSPPKLEDSHLTDHSSLLAEVENEVDSLSWPVLLFAGALAGVNGWLVTFAFDVIKTRVQSVDRFTSPSNNSLDGRHALHPYRNTVSTIINSYRSEGLGVFVRGLSPTLLRAIPVNMATFGVFETVVHLLSRSGF